MSKGWLGLLKAALIQCLLWSALLLPRAQADGIDVIAKLSAHEFTALESHYEDVEARFERQALSERELMDAYFPLYRKEDTLSDAFAAWIDQRPLSYVAHLCRGIYLRRLGEHRRGDSYSPSAANVEYMARMHVLAKKDLLEALRLRPGSYVAVFHLLNIAQFDGDRQAARTHLDAANKLVPGNLLARARYLITLAPKWHGSHAQMEAFIQETQANGVTEQLVRWLQAITSDDRASVTFHTGDDAGAATHVAEALRLGADMGPRFQSDYLGFSTWYRKAGEPASAKGSALPPVLRRTIQWTVWGLTLVAVMGWVARSWLKLRHQRLPCELRHPPSTLFIGLFGFALFTSIGLMPDTTGKNDTVSVWTDLAFLFFAVMSLAMVAEYFLARHRLTPDGLEFGRLLGRRGKLKWADVHSVEYASTMKWFKVRTEQGTTVRISAMLMGLPEFAHQLLSHVPAKRITEPTRSIPAETADGSPPSVW